MAREPTKPPPGYKRPPSPPPPPPWRAAGSGAAVKTGDLVAFIPAGESDPVRAAVARVWSGRPLPLVNLRLLRDDSVVSSVPHRSDVSGADSFFYLA